MIGPEVLQETTDLGVEVEEENLMTLNVIIAEIPVIFKEIVQVDVIWEDTGEMIEADREETLIITTIGEEIMEDLIREEREAIQETEIEKEMIQEI